MPALSNPAARSNGGPSFPISVDARASNDPAAVEAAVYRGLAAATPTIIHLAKGGTMGELSRPVLPGGAG